MRKIKAMRNKIISLTLILVIVLPLCFANDIMQVFASETNVTFEPNEVSQEQKVAIINYQADIEEFVRPIFGDRSIKTCEYLYNLDDSSDYIYVEFETGGYVVYAKETMEMMEYSLQGTLPYDSAAKKYYAGPSNYLHKSGAQFYDALSGEKIVIAESEKNELAQKVRKATINQNAPKYDVQAANTFSGAYMNKIEETTILPLRSSVSEENEQNLIEGKDYLGTLIPNYRYFVENPTIGQNTSDTCGPVAAQLLLGYHNYYSDRRIIPDNYLLGYDDATETVKGPEMNPNYCSEPMEMNTFTLGTRSGNENNSFYMQMVSQIMPSLGEGSTNINVKNGIENYLFTRLSLHDYSVTYRFSVLGLSGNDSSFIKSEIDAHRPIIISISGVLSGGDLDEGHFVVGYGYQNYTYSTGAGTYEGYVVHYGWTGFTCIWINSAWCDGYVSLNIEHDHEYYAVKPIATGSGFEYKCRTCGHRTDAIVSVSSSEVYKELTTHLIKSEYKEYKITFQTTGNWLFQTFGNKDTHLFLYDTQYNQLVAVDDNGYNYNAYFNYNVQAGTTYILRVKFWSRSIEGDVKVGITAAPSASSTYANLIGAYGTDEQYAFSVLQNKAQVCTFTPSESGLYKFEYSFAIPNEGYIRLYVIDPTSTIKCWWSNEGSFANTITADLTYGIPYYIIIGDGATMPGEVVCLSVGKIQ